MALADFKQACPQTTTSQTVYVNVHPKHQHDEAQTQSSQKQQTDVEDLSDVTVVKPDCGVKYDGLLHISKMHKTGIKHPSELLSVGDLIKVKVLDVDYDHHKLQLELLN